MNKNLLMLGLIISTIGCSSAPGGDGSSNGVSASDPDFEYLGVMFFSNDVTSWFRVFYSEKYNLTCMEYHNIDGSLDCEKGELFEGMK